MRIKSIKSVKARELGGDKLYIIVYHDGSINVLVNHIEVLNLLRSYEQSLDFPTVHEVTLDLTS